MDQPKVSNASLLTRQKIKITNWTPLFSATEKNDLDTVFKIINKKDSKLTRSINGWTALMLAVKNGNEKIARLLLLEKPNINYVNPNGVSALFLAISGNHIEILNLILLYKVDIKIFNKLFIDEIEDCFIENTSEEKQLRKKWLTPLMYAAHLGRHDITRLLLETSAKTFLDQLEMYVNAKNDEGHNALFFAIRNGHSEVVELLLDFGADFVDENDNNVLITAFTFGRREVMECLITQWDGNFNATNKDGLNVLMLAAKSNDISMLEILLKCSDCVNCFDKFRFVYNLFCSSQEDSIIKDFLNTNHGRLKTGQFIRIFQCRNHINITNTTTKRIDINFKNQYGLNVLSIAADNLHFSLMWVFLAFGVEFSFSNLIRWLHAQHCQHPAKLNNSFFQFYTQIQSEHKQHILQDENVSQVDINPYNAYINEVEISRPLLIAAYNGKCEEFHRLLDVELNVNLEENGWTPLLIAAQRDHTCIVYDILLRSGVDIDCEIKGWTAVMFAAKNGNLNITKLLLQKSCGVKKCYNGWDAFRIACYYGNVSIVEYLLISRAGIVSTKDVLNPIIISFSEGHQNVVDLLINDERCLNNMYNGYNTLMMASYYGFSKLVKLLIGLKNKKYRLSNGVKALTLAFLNGHEDIVLMLLEDERLRVEDDVSFLIGICFIMHGTRENVFSIQNMKSSMPFAHIGKNKKNSCRCTLLLKIIQCKDLKRYIDYQICLFLAAYCGCVELLRIPFYANVDMNLFFDSKTALMIAAEYGHHSLVETLISSDADITLIDENGWNALMYASSAGHLRVVKLLLEHGADVDAIDNAGWTASMLAASMNHLDILQCLSKDGANFMLKQVDGWNSLMLASYHGKQNTLAYLLKYSWKDEDLLNSIVLAIYNDAKDIVETIVLTKNIDINIFYNNSSLLMLAAGCGKLETVKMLINHGANIHLRNYFGLNVLMYAELGGHENVITFLKTLDTNYSQHVLNEWDDFISLIKFNSLHVSPQLYESQDFYSHLFKVIQIAIDMKYTTILPALYGYSKNKDFINMNGNNHLTVASAVGNFDTALYLLELRHDANFINYYGSSALMLASENGHLSVVRLLYKYKARINQKNLQEKTALMLATKQGHSHVVQFLLSKKCMVNHQDIDGMTALMIAAEEGHANIVDILIKNRSYIHLKNRKRQDALSLAIINKNVDTVKILLKHLLKTEYTNLMYLRYLFLAVLVEHEGIIKMILKGDTHINMTELIALNEQMLCNKLTICDNLLFLTDMKKCTSIPLTGFSVLMLASRFGNPDIVALLLEGSPSREYHKDFVNATNEQGNNALYFAIQNGHTKVVEILLKHDADYTDEKGNNIVILTCNYRQYSVLQPIQKYWSGDMNAANNNGLNALLIAVEKSDINCIQNLLDYSKCTHNLDVFKAKFAEYFFLNAKNLNKFDALCKIECKHQAFETTQNNNDEFVSSYSCMDHLDEETFNKKTININFQNKDEINAAFIAAENFNFDLMWSFLLHGVDVRGQDLILWFKMVSALDNESVFLNNPFLQLMEKTADSVELTERGTEMQDILKYTYKYILSIERSVNLKILKCPSENQFVDAKHVDLPSPTDVRSVTESANMFPFYLFQKCIYTAMETSEDIKERLPKLLANTNFCEITLTVIQKHQIMDTRNQDFSLALAYVTLSNLDIISALNRQLAEKLLGCKAIEFFTQLLSGLKNVKVPHFIFKMTIHILYNLTRIKNVLYTFVQQNTAKVIESYYNMLSQLETKLRWIILMTCIIGNMEEFPYLSSNDVAHLLSEIIKFTNNKCYVAPWSNLELLTVLSRLSLNHHIRKHILLLQPLDIFNSILKSGEREEILVTIDCMYSLSKEESFSLSIVDNRACFTTLKNLCVREHEECIKPIRRLFWRMASENSLALKFDSLLSETFPISFNVITQEVNAEIIGKGAFGTVRLICNQDRPYEKKFVAKSIPLITDEGSDVCNREISILARIRHKRIVPFHGFMKNKDCIDIFFEYMTLGTLTDLIKSKKQLDEKTTRLLTAQILEGVNYLHEQNVIHRDIKGSNILMKSEFSLKIGDFGLSKLTSNNTTTKTADVGTIRYMAPEVIKAETDTCHKYKQNVDIWSVGCTVVEMITGSPPNSMYEEHTVVFKLASHIKPEYTLPDGVSNALRKFISRTLEIEPEYRPHAKTLLENDEFITGVSKQYDYINIILTSKCLTDELEKYGFDKQLTSFTAVKYFSVRNIPPHYEHRQNVVQLIHAIAQLTVLIGIEYMDQGKTEWKFCSGMLYLNSFERFTEENNKVCSCFECQNSDSRILNWVEVEVVTSARVLSDVKVNSFYVRVGFDDDENQGYVLSGLKIMNCDKDSDRCTLACSCHDVYLFADLQSTWTNYMKLQTVREFFKSSRDKHRLTVTVCHPLGCCKHLSFGEWLDKKNIQQVPLSASYYTRYCYTTPLCTGCEGAPVIILGSGIDSIIHAHSYTKNDVNYTGTGLN